MLAELCIENLVLIESARLEFHTGLNVFTGETGAGKSLLIDALGLVFGGKGDPGLVRPGAAQAEVSARFLLNDRELAKHLAEELGIVFDFPDKGPVELVVSRVLPVEGRAKAYANGRPMALPTLKDLGDQVLDIHGQHENQSLLRPAARLEILDHFSEALKERVACRKAWQDAKVAAETLEELRAAVRDRQGREELYRFQLKELEDARLDEMSPEELENELKLLRGAEKIRSAAEAAAYLLDGEDGDAAAQKAARALKGLQALGDAGGDAEKLTERMESLLSETRDLASDLTALAEKASGDPERLAELEELRGNWKSLERKHGRDLAGLAELRDELRGKIESLEQSDTRIARAEDVLEKAIAELKHAASALSKKRKAGAKELEKQTAAELEDLGLKGAALKVQLVPHEAKPGATELERLLPAQYHATGAESAELLFSANRDLPEKPLSECASGGEISRVMLSLKGVLARAGGADRLPVVVFDEVDSGVGGRLGAMLGRKLGELSKVRQLLVITHLPQVAAYGLRQLKVDKKGAGKTKEKSGPPAVTVTALTEAERVDELALMLRGDTASARTKEEAQEMLSAAQKEMTQPGKRKK